MEPGSDGLLSGKPDIAFAPAKAILAELSGAGKTPFGMVALDESGRVASANARALEHLEQRDDAVLGTQFAGYVHPDDRPVFRRSFERLRAGESDPAVVEARIVGASGHTMRCALAGFSVPCGTGRLYPFLLVNMSDIEGARVRDLRFHTALRGAAIVYFELAPDGKIMFANNAACELVGKPSAELVGTPLARMLPREQAGLLLEPLLLVAGGRGPIASCNCTLRDAAGADHALRLFLIPDGEEGGAIGRVLVPAMDLTRVGVVARESESLARRFDSLVAASESLAFETAPDGVLVRLWGPSEALLGYAEEEIRGSPFPPYIHADDLARASEVLGRWKPPRDPSAARADSAARIRSTLCRLRRRNGTWGTFRMTAVDAPAAGSEAARVVGMLRDVTDDADRVKRLGERDGVYGAMLDSERVWIVVCDAAGTVTALSRAYELSTGFYRAERLSRPIAAMLAPGAPQEAANFWERPADGSPTRFVRASFARREAAEACVVDLQVQAIWDPNGAFLGCTAVGRDVTLESRREAIELERNELAREVAELRNEIQGKYGLDQIIGTDAKMRAVFETILAVSRTQATVLIQGETGTGKELVAKAIHYNSGRQDQPFIKVDCGALSENLLESELFGHVKGAFTGAIRDRPGRFELADKGTIFLDEVQNLSFGLQAKLLRVVQEGRFEKVGGSTTEAVDVRIIAATNADLGALVEEGKIRKDLYYRLNVIPIHLPPLRDRPGDIPHLVRSFIGKYAERHGKEVRSVSKEALDSLLGYEWPGNVRELENIIEQAVVFSHTGIIQREDMRLPRVLGASRTAAGPAPAIRSLKEALGDPEKQLIVESIERAGNNRRRAAELLGISRSAFYEKLKRYGLSSKRRGDE